MKNGLTTKNTSPITTAHKEAIIGIFLGLLTIFLTFLNISLGIISFFVSAILLILISANRWSNNTILLYRGDHCLNEITCADAFYDTLAFIEFFKVEDYFLKIIKPTGEEEILPISPFGTIGKSISDITGIDYSA